MSPIFTFLTTVVAIYFTFYLIRPIDLTKILPQSPRNAALLKVVLATIIGFLLATALVGLLNEALQIPSSLLKDL